MFEEFCWDLGTNIICRQNWTKLAAVYMSFYAHVQRNSLIIFVSTHFFMNECRSRDSSVGIATGYGLDFLGSIPGKDKRFFSSPRCSDWLWCPSSVLANGYRRHFTLLYLYEWMYERFIYLFIYLFIYDLFIDVVARIIWRRMVQWLWTRNWNGCGRKWSWSILKHCPEIRLEEGRKPRNLPVRIFGVPAEIQAWKSDNRSHNRYRLSQLALCMHSSACLCTWLRTYVYMYVRLRTYFYVFILFSLELFKIIWKSQVLFCIEWEDWTVIHYYSYFLKEDEAVLADLNIRNMFGNLRKILRSLVLLMPRLRLEPSTSLTQNRQDITHFLVHNVCDEQPTCFRYSNRGVRVRACCRASRPSHHHIRTHSRH
jgi:hypothetical protein